MDRRLLLGIDLQGSPATQHALCEAFGLLEPVLAAAGPGAARGDPRPVPGVPLPVELARAAPRRTADVRAAQGGGAGLALRTGNGTPGTGDCT